MQSPHTQDLQQAWAVPCTFCRFPTEKGGGGSHQLTAACPGLAPQGPCSVSVTKPMPGSAGHFLRVWSAPCVEPKAFSKNSWQQSGNDQETPDPPCCNLSIGVSMRAWSPSLSWNGAPILCSECHPFPTAFRSEAKTKDHQLINGKKSSHYLPPSPSYYKNTTLSCCELPKF